MKIWSKLWLLSLVWLAGVSLPTSSWAAPARPTSQPLPLTWEQYQQAIRRARASTNPVAQDAVQNYYAQEWAKGRIDEPRTKAYINKSIFREQARLSTKEKAVLSRGPQPSTALPPHPLAQIEARLEVQRIQRELGFEKTSLLVKDVTGKTSAELAAELNKTPSAVRKQLQRLAPTRIELRERFGTFPTSTSALPPMPRPTQRLVPSVLPTIPPPSTTPILTPPRLPANPLVLQNPPKAAVVSPVRIPPPKYRPISMTHTVGVRTTKGPSRGAAGFIASAIVSVLPWKTALGVVFVLGAIGAVFGRED